MAASDQQLLWEGLGLQEAAASYREGRLAECRDSLLAGAQHTVGCVECCWLRFSGHVISAVQLQGFSRVRWYVESNLLACRLQVGPGGAGASAG